MNTNGAKGISVALIVMMFAVVSSTTYGQFQHGQPAARSARGEGGRPHVGAARSAGAPARSGMSRSEGAARTPTVRSQQGRSERNITPPSRSATAPATRSAAPNRSTLSNRSEGTPTATRRVSPSGADARGHAVNRSAPDRSGPRRTVRGPDGSSTPQRRGADAAVARLDRAGPSPDSRPRTRAMDDQVGKSRTFSAERRRDGWYRNPNSTIYSRRPVHLSYSTDGRRSGVRAGLSLGANGIRAYYDRRRFGHDDRFGPDRWHRRHGFASVSYCGEFYGGVYYPYGYASRYDCYFHRYPYRYAPIHAAPLWSVYVDSPPVVETVYVESPQRTVYVDRLSEGDVAYSTESAESPTYNTESVGPAIPSAPRADTGSVETGTPIEVQPQDRIPVNNESLAAGERTFRDGDYESARQSFAHAVLEEPDNGFAQLAYGMTHFATGDYKAAADAFRRGLSAAPDVVDLPIDVARHYGRPEDLGRQLNNLQLHVAAHPDDADAWFVLGYVQYSTGAAAEAGRSFDKASSLDPSDSHSAVLRDAAQRVSKSEQ